MVYTKWWLLDFCNFLIYTCNGENMTLPMPKRVPPPGFYYHYKHDPNGPVNNHAYEVVGIGFHTEDDPRPGEEHFLVYRPLYEASVYKASKQIRIPCFDARPLEMWMGKK